jgi:BASS family bile acid:Na+ symporter
MLLIELMNGDTINRLLNVVLALIMGGLGLSLTRDDFRHLYARPRALSVGLAAQVLLLPLIAYALVQSGEISPGLKVGIMILSVCPGGITSNLISYFLKGNVALAISLTVANAVLTLFSIPFLVNLFLIHFMQGGKEFQLPFWEVMYEITVVTVLPASLGLLLRSRLPALAKKIEKPMNLASTALLALVFMLKIFSKEDSGGAGLSWNDVVVLMPYVMLLNFLSMFGGFFAGTLFALPFKDKITISVEVGLHNTALALLIAGNILHNHEMEKPALVYAISSFFITFAVAWLLGRINKAMIQSKRKTDSGTR